MVVASRGEGAEGTPGDRPGTTAFADSDLLRQLLGDAPIGIAVLDSTFHYLEINQAFSALCDQAPEAHLGRTPAEVAPAIWEAVKDDLHRVLGGETVESLVTSETGAHPRYWLLHSFPLLTDGRVTAIGVMGHDVTEFRGSERALRARTELYLMLARTNELVASCSGRQELFQGVCEIAVTAGGFVLAWIAAVEGDAIRPVAVAGSRVDYLRHVDISLSRDDDQARGPTGLVFQGHTPVIVNDFLTDPVTNPWHDAARQAGLRSSASFALYQGGEVVAALGMYSDERDYFTPERVDTLSDMVPMVSLALDQFAAESELIRGQAALRRKEEEARLLALLVESANDAIVSMSLDGVITTWNQGAVRLYGYSADEAIGRPIASVTIPSDRYDEVDFIFDSAREGRQISGYETRRLTKGGDVIDVSVTVSPIYAPDGSLLGASSVAVDISDRLRHRRERRVIAERVGQLDRLESLGRLAGGIAHDFNNLLSVIMNNAVFAERDLYDEDKTRADIAQIREAATRAAALTKQLLAFGRRDVRPHESLELNSVIRGLEGLLEKSMKADVRLMIDLEEGLWPVEADRGQFEQVVMNLVFNARDACSPGSVIVIDTANIVVDESYADVRPSLQPGHYVRLRVSDTGTGMDQDTVRHAFEPFFTTKPVGEGTGLGLPSVYGIVTHAGGDVQLYSEVGIGTTCRVLLPASSIPAAASTGHDEARGEDYSGHETILVVEDEDSLRLVTQRILEDHGYKVLACSSGPEALLRASLYGGEIDLLLTDVVMPEMAGTEVARRIWEIRPDLPVLLMSGYAQPVIDSIISRGAILLDKPFTEEELLRNVRTTLRSGRWLAK